MTAPHTPVEPEGEQPPPNPGGAAGIGIAVVDRIVDKASRWTPQQAIMVAALLSMLVTNGLVVWQMYDSRNDRRDERAMMEARMSSMVRDCNSQMELNRQSYSSVVKDMQTTYLQHDSAENQKQREYEASRDKDWQRVMMQIQNAWAAFAVKMADLERTIRNGKKPPEEEMPSISPFPHKKVNVP